MCLVVSGVGFLIHVYSIGYMHNDPGFPRFFSFLNLFCFMMLNLVLADNILLMFLGWEGVGLCSYLLIGFWYNHYPNTVAANKAFIVNRIGDLGFLIGIFLLFWTLGSKGVWTLDFAHLRVTAYLLQGEMIWGASVATLITLFFFIGATGKSAQIPLYVWLPNAMAGPTPVSALIHAATMVTAGVYMVCRLNFLFELSHTTMTIIATVGMTTAIFAGIIGFVQNDIKKVLAYSTISQLGYMFLATGVGNYTAGIFHLVTHAFFKACLFLGAGSVILGMHHEQDIQKMGAVKKYMPITYITFLFSTIAICGIFPFSGFFSKDEILLSVFLNKKILWIFGLIGAFATSFYMSRLLILTFWGRERFDTHHTHVKESPYVITIPLIILGFAALVGGIIGLPGVFYHKNYLHEFLSSVFISRHAQHVSHELEILLMCASLLVSIFGISLALLFYIKKPNLVLSLTHKFKLIYKIVYNKFFIDEIYTSIFVNNTIQLMKILARFDLVVIDGLVNLNAYLIKVYAYITGWIDNTFVDGLVNLLANITIETGVKLKRIQTGKIQNYTYVLFVSVLIIVIIGMLV